MRTAAPTINMKGKIGFELGGTRSTFSKAPLKTSSASKQPPQAREGPKGRLLFFCQLRSARIKREFMGDQVPAPFITVEVASQKPSLLHWREEDISHGNVPPRATWTAAWTFR